MATKRCSVLNDNSHPRAAHSSIPKLGWHADAGHVHRVGDEKWVYTFDQFVDLGYVWVTASDQIPTGPSGGLVQVNLTRTINDNSTVAGKTELPNSLGYYCETLLNVLQV